MTLHEQVWSQRRIARELGINRETVARNLKPDSKPAIAEKAPTGSRSLCEPNRESILSWLEQGLSAQRMYQDLVVEHGFTGSYPSVRRYVAKLKNKMPLPFRRIEVGPGEEAQIDFGTGAPVIDENGKRRRTLVLRVVLSHSRKGYSESVVRERGDVIIRIFRATSRTNQQPIRSWR